MSSTRSRAKKSGRKTRRNEFLPLFKTLYQKGGATIVWTTQGTYSVTAYVGKTTSATNTLTITATVRSNSGDGLKTAASLFNPLSFDVDSAGNILILEAQDGKLRRVDTTGNVQTLVLEGGVVDGKYAAMNDYPYNNSMIPPFDNSISAYGYAKMAQPYGIALNKQTDVFYFTERNYHYLRAALADSGSAFSGRAVSILQQSRNSTTAAVGLTTAIYSNPGNQRIDGPVENSSTRTFNASLFHPFTLAIDPAGTRMYIVENLTHIRMVDLTGFTSYYVSSLYKCDNTIQNITVDNHGKVYFTMVGKHSIWMITPPAPGTQSPSGRGNGGNTPLLNQTPRPAGSSVGIFAGNDGSGDHTDSTTLLNARFNDPRGLAVDSNNNIYVADRGNAVIRVITPAGAVYTFAGTSGSSTNLGNYANAGDGPNTLSYFSNPFAVAVGRRLGHTSSDVVYVLDGGDGWNSSSATSAPVTSSNCLPWCRIRRLTQIPPPNSPTSFTLVYADSTTATFRWGAGSGITGSEALGYGAMFYFLVKQTPTSAEVRVDLPANTNNPPVIGNTYLSGSKNPDNAQQGFYINNHISVQLTPNTAYSSVKLVAFNNSGSNVSTSMAVTTLPEATNYTTRFSGTGTTGYINGNGPDSKFGNSLRGIVMDLASNLYVSDTANNCIRKINTIGNTSLFFGTPNAANNGPTGLSAPVGLTFSATGDFPLYIADNANNRIMTVTNNGTAAVFTTTGVSIESPSGITVDPNGNLYVVSQGKHCIYKITTARVVSVYAGISGTEGYINGPGSSATFSGPSGITYDAYNNCLYVSDTHNHLIRKIGLDGAATVGTLAGSQGLNGTANGLGSVARFNTPRELATDVNGNVYVCDSENHCIRKITIAGFVTTYSGTMSTWGNTDGTSRPTAYNAITTNVKYKQPYGICRGAPGNFIIADTGNALLRILSSTPPPTPPTSIYLSAITTTTASIAWSGDTGATFYAYAISPPGEFIGMPVETSSPATFENLSDGSAYSMTLIVASPSGVVYSTPVPCVTPVDPDNFVVKVPYTECISLIGGTLATATMAWTGAAGANSLVCTISPPDQGGNTSGTLPQNAKSPYKIKGLVGNTSYSVTLTATYNSIPGVGEGATAAPFTITTTPVTFTTIPPRDVSVKILAGRPNPPSSSTLREMDPVNAPASDKPPAGVTQYTPRNDFLLKATMTMARDIVMDGNGSLYVACQSCIVKIDPPTDKLYIMNGDDPVQLLPTPHSLGAADPTIAPGSPIPAATAGSKISLYAGDPTNTSGTMIAANGSWPGTQRTGTNIIIYNCTALGYDKVNKFLYVSDTLLHIIIKIWTDSNGNTQATHFAGKVGDANDVDGALANTAKFKTPTGLAVGPDGSVFVCCTGGGNIRKIKNGQVTTISGSGAIGSSGMTGNSAHGITVLADGSVYVAATAEHCIYKFTPNASQTSYTQSIYAGEKGTSGHVDGPIANARFSAPLAMYSDSAGDIYVYDTINPRIRVISGGKVYTILGTGSRGSTNGGTDVATIPGYSELNDILVSDVVYGGMAGDVNGNIYFTNSNDPGGGQGKGYVVRALIPAPPPIYPQAVFDNWINVKKDSAAQIYRASSAVAQSVSSAKFYRASSAVAQAASSAVGQRASTAQASSAVAQGVSSAIAQTVSSAIAQSKSGAQASSAVAQGVSSAVAQTTSSAIAQRVSSAQASSAVAQEASSAVAETVSSAIAQSKSGAQASSAVAQEASSAIAQSKSGAQASSAVAQTASSAIAQEASSAVAQTVSSAIAQTVSSALAQRISGAEASSAVAQTVSSAIAQSKSGAQASSAVAQTASSAIAQSKSGAQASSAVAQTASSALAQQISGAQASSAVAQTASSALAQRISGAEASSAVAQTVSSALAQRVSGSEASSAVAQTASSAIAQSKSGAQASSAVAQTASSALAQQVSGAQASSAYFVSRITPALNSVAAAKTNLSSRYSQIRALIRSINSGQATNANISALKTEVVQVKANQDTLGTAWATIQPLQPDYQDTSLYTTISDPELNALGHRKVFDRLRNVYIVLNSNGMIIPNPVTPATRVYV